MRLSLCMIVRDNEAYLAESLQSIRPWVDELIVVDTGSKDRTPQIAESLGAKVSYFPWVDDSSAARNASLAAASGEWLFWMDSDDVIDANCGARLRALADGPHRPETLGYVMQVHCPGIPASDVTIVDHVKLFLNRPDLRFEGRIHEQVLPAIRRAAGEVAWTDIFVTHKHAAVAPKDRVRKYERDLRILREDLRERPEHPFVLFNLGMTLADMGEFHQAAGYLERSIRAAGPDESHLRKAYALLVGCHLQTGELDEAENLCRTARERFPDDPEILFRSGIVAHHRKNFSAAIQNYRQLLQLGERTAQPRFFSSRDTGIEGYKARHNLASVYLDLAKWEHAELQWRLALEECSSFEPAFLGLGEVLIRQGKWKSAREVCRRRDSQIESGAAGALFQAKIALAQHDWQKAIDSLNTAIERYPERGELYDALSQALFAQNRFEEARDTLERLLMIDPQNTSAHHNLGTAYLALNEFHLAARHLNRSLELRPDHGPTREQLQRATEALMAAAPAAT